MINYSQYSYLWPPRPEQVITPVMLPFYEKQGWVAQYKKNGTCTLIFTNGKEVIYKTRHNEDHKAWTPLPEHNEYFREIAKSGNWYVFEAELLHSKGEIKNHLHIFDCLVWDGEYLIGSTLPERVIKCLAYLTFFEDKYFSITITFTTEFQKLFQDCQNEDEGLVLKNPLTRLNVCSTPSSNSKWQVKCRRETKNYGY